jgi:charged multivesicular body protein 4A/B
MWSTLFGGGAAVNKKKQDEAKNAIVKLREQVNMLEKKEAHLQKQIDDLTATAKRNVTTNKKGVFSLLLSSSISCPVWGRSTGLWTRANSV